MARTVVADGCVECVVGKAPNSLSFGFHIFKTVRRELDRIGWTETTKSAEVQGCGLKQNDMLKPLRLKKHEIRKEGCI